MSASDRLDRSRTALVVVDVQERFAPAIDGWEQLIARAAILTRTARLLGLPVVATEQYPKGLGPTVAPIAAELGETVPLEKTGFAATSAPGFSLDERDQALLCGVEAHVCVLQTALELIERGVQVQLVTDATGSRSRADLDTALRRMELAGVTPTTVEAAGFELLGSSQAEGFREFQELIK